MGENKKGGRENKIKSKTEKRGKGEGVIETGMKTDSLVMARV